MSHSSRDDYLKAEVLTASPQKLQLMLIEAAIRNVRQGYQALQDGNADAAKQPLLKAQDIVGQILSGLRSEHAPDLAGKVAAIYVFVLRALVEGMIDGVPEKLAGVLRVLEEERTTWAQLCEQLGAEPSQHSTLSGPHRQQVLNSIPAHGIQAGENAHITGDDVSTSQGSFNLEA
ncbi:MAG: flagellar protein FliS [Pirellulales bacterium]|nr:flagellar protein FliS [Pirellulales bacterium]